MKVKVNIRKFIEKNADHRDLLLVHASVDVGDLFDTNEIPAEHEIDIHDALAAQQAIAITISADDVLDEIRPDLSSQQAWSVLLAFQDRLRWNRGFILTRIDRLASEIFPRVQDIAEQPPEPHNSPEPSDENPTHAEKE
jgi:hypothetical protein